MQSCTDWLLVRGCSHSIYNYICCDCGALQYKLVVTVHRCRQYRAPRYLTDYCGWLCLKFLVASIYDLPDVVNSLSPQHIGSRAIPVTGPAVWNSLPDINRIQLLTVNIFVKSWKHLFTGDGLTWSVSALAAFYVIALYTSTFTYSGESELISVTRKKLFWKKWKSEATEINRKKEVIS